MITIIVPVHNTGIYLNKCLDSIKKQTFKNIEVLCIDSSNDESTNIILKYIEKDSRFKLIKDNNSSYGYKINLGIALAKGNYIGIVDSDDYIGLKMYERAYNAIKKYHVDFVKFDYESFSTHPAKHKHYINYTVDNNLYNRVFNSKENPNVFYDSNVAIWSGLYKKKFIVNNNIKLNETPGASFQDTGFFVLTHLYAKKILYINEAYYKYRQNSIDGSSLSNKNTFSVIYEFDYILDKIKRKKDITTKQYNSILCRKFFSYSWNYLRLNNDLANKFERKVRKDLKKACVNNIYNEMPTRIKKYINDSGIIKSSLSGKTI